jgi:hypothetical protein
MTHSPYSETFLKKIIYVDNQYNEKGVAVINTDQWVQPDSDDDILKMTSFIAKILSDALLKSQRLGKDRFDIIVYMEKFKVKSINYKFVKYMTGILKQLFPDKLENCTLIDPPRFFINAYEIIKHFMDKPTRKKFRLISSKEEKILYEDRGED